MQDTAALATGLESLDGARVVCVGDVILDRFVYGEVRRLSQEAPIPILEAERETAMLGGAGNVLRNLAALGARPSLVAVVGDDAPGRHVRALGEAETADCRLVVQPDRPTTIKERFIAAGQQLLCVGRETARPLAPSAAQALEAAARAALEAAPAPGALILSDYGRGALGPETVARLISAARGAGWAVVVDPRARDLGRYRGASVLTPNRRELSAATSLPVGDDDEAAAACRAALDAAGVEAILATRSEQGMTMARRDGPGGAPETSHFRARAREVFDVSGAGDTVVAVVAAGLAAGLDLALAARLANVAAGIVVGKQGTAVARPVDILHALHASDVLAAEAKITDFDGMLARAARWRAAGLKVGFTNGCFDLLHPGHVELLAHARGACDRLVMGLNSDASVRRLKGADRPVQSEAARAAVLVSLASVDLVVVFGEDTPLRLIEALRPDIMVKGADYTIERIPGADVVRSYGGEVILAPLAPGYSTTRTIEKLGRETGEKLGPRRDGP